MRVKNHFWVKGENFGQQEAIFRKMKFTVVAKRLGLGENDFLKSFSPKTNAPLIEFVWNKIAFIYYQTMGPIVGLKWTKTRKHLHLHLQNAFRLAGTNECGLPF